MGIRTIVRRLDQLLTGTPATRHRPLYRNGRWESVAEATFDVRAYGNVTTATDAGSVTANTTAIQAAIDAAEAAGGGTVLIPARYRVNPLTVNGSGIVLQGVSRVASGLDTLTGDLLTLGDSAAVSNFTCTNLLLWSRPGGGHVFANASSLAHAFFSNLTVIQENDAKSYYWHEGADYIDVLWQVIDAQHTLTATIAGWHIKSPAANRNKWQSIRPTYSGNYVWMIESTAVSAYATENTIEGVTAEVTRNGLINLKGCRGSHLSDIGIYDLGGTTTKDLIKLEGSATSIQTFHTLLTNVRRHGGTLGGGLYDVNVAGTNATPEVTFVNCGGSTPLQVNAASKRVAVIGSTAVTVTNDESTVYSGSGGARKRYQAVAVDTALSVFHSDTVFENIASSGTTTYTLPATSRGVTYTFLCGNAGGEMHISPNAADKIMGSGITAADDKDLINTNATNAVGDLITLIGDGLDGWWVIQKVGTWEREG